MGKLSVRCRTPRPTPTGSCVNLHLKLTNLLKFVIGQDSGSSKLRTAKFKGTLWLYNFNQFSVETVLAQP